MQDLVSTLPEANVAPENRPIEKESGLPTTIFQGRIVSFRECKSSNFDLGGGFKHLLFSTLPGEMIQFD